MLGGRTKAGENLEEIDEELADIRKEIENLGGCIEREDG
jgi:hypothetical protein